jgi:hypothetical protein
MDDELVVAHVCFGLGVVMLVLAVLSARRPPERAASPPISTHIPAAVSPAPETHKKNKKNKKNEQDEPGQAASLVPPPPPSPPVTEVGVFWDYDNLPIPRTAKPGAFMTNLMAYLSKLGHVRVFEAFGFFLGNNEHIAESQVCLAAHGVKLLKMPSRAKRARKNQADFAMVQAMTEFTNAHPVCTVVVISQDADFGRSVNGFRMRGAGGKVWTVLLSPPEHSSLRLAFDKWASLSMITSGVYNDNHKPLPPVLVPPPPPVPSVTTARPLLFTCVFCNKRFTDAAEYIKHDSLEKWGLAD